MTLLLLLIDYIKFTVIFIWIINYNFYLIHDLIQKYDDKITSDRSTIGKSARKFLFSSIIKYLYLS